MYISDLRDILIKFFNNRAWVSRFNVIFYSKDYKTKIIIQIASDIMVQENFSYTKSTNMNFLSIDYIYANFAF